MFEELEQLSDVELGKVLLERMKLRSLVELLRDGVESRIYSFITMYCLTAEQARIIRERVEHSEGIHRLPDEDEALSEVRVALGLEKPRV